MNKVKRGFSLFLVFALLFSLGACGSTKDPKEEQRLFDEFVEKDFVELMESDYLEMHAKLENPEKYGVDKEKVKVQLGEYYSKDNNKEDEELEKTIEEFESFDRDLLTDEQQETYDIFEFIIENNEEYQSEDFEYYDSIFGTTSGLHTQFPTFFADYELRNEEDLKDMILLLKDVKPYINSYLTYTKEQAKEGLMMIQFDEVISYCQNIVDKGLDSSTIKEMYASVDKLNLGVEKATQYKKEIEEAYTTSYLEAYKDIIATLTELKSEKNNEEGLAKFKNGKDYYELLYRIRTGSEHDVKEMKSILEGRLEAANKELLKLAFTNMDLYESFFNGEIKTKYSDFDSMLQDVFTLMAEDFPEIGELDYTIKALNEDLVNSGIAAYFILPAIDRSVPMSIYVNMNTASIDSLQTFSTVMHEGLPGHMYQISYAYKNFDSNWRKVNDDFLGYTEGYATYVETYGMKYLKDVNEEVIRMHRLTNEVSMYAMALADIGIHYEGWSLEELEDYFMDMGLNAEAAKEVYPVLQSNPTLYLSYYVGYVEIMELKEYAQTELGDNFSDKEFHKALLKSGQAPFKVVKENIEDYVESND